jgi:hypothetical protein
MKLVLLFISVLFITLPANANIVGVDDLLDAPGVYAGSQITLIGELIGDYGERSDGVWVHLNDDAHVDAPLPTAELAGMNTGIGFVSPQRYFVRPGERQAVLVSAAPS